MDRMARCRMERCEHAFKEAKSYVISCVRCGAFLTEG